MPELTNCVTKYEWRHYSQNRGDYMIGQLKVKKGQKVEIDQVVFTPTDDDDCLIRKTHLHITARTV